MYLFSYVDCCIRNIPMVDCYIRCLYIFHIFQYVRWLLCIILLQSFVTASVLSSHTSSSHMLIVDLLFWYLHLNYKPIFNTHQLFIPTSCKIAKFQLQNVSSLLRHFDKLLQCGQPHHNSILVVVAFTYQYTTDSAAPPDHYREAEVGAAPAIRQSLLPLLSQWCSCIVEINLQADKLRHGYLLITVTGS